MAQSHSSRADLTAALGLCLLLGAVGRAAAWQVYVDQVDLSGAAAPMLRANTLLTNAATVGPALGLAVQVTGDQVEITDRAGSVWQGRDNGTLLSAGGRTVALGFPAQVREPAAYLPIDAMAGLAGLRMDMDATHRRVVLRAPRPADVDAPAGWEPLTIDKSAEERAALAREQGSAFLAGSASAAFHRPPPDHDSLRVSYGLGYVRDADVGFEVSAAGRVSGRDVHASQLLTHGSQGIRLHSAHVSLTDRDAGWGLEGGDVSSDLWGLRRGVRYSWGQERGRKSSLGLYAGEGGPLKLAPVAVYRDEMRLGPRWTFGGEVASSGAGLARTALQTRSLGVVAYGRRGAAPGSGLFATWSLGGGFRVSAGLSTSSTSLGPNTLRSFSVTVPLWRDADLTLEQMQTSLRRQRSTLNVATVGFPVGPLRVLTRYQFGESNYLSPVGPDGTWWGVGTREWTGIVGYSRGSRLRLDYQMRMQWAGASQRPAWDQLLTSYRFGPRTELMAISGFPTVADPRQLHLRLEHGIGRGTSLTMEYGQVAPYQSRTQAPREGGLRILLCRKMEISTPAGGGTIHGTVKDQVGRPVPGVAVCWNGFSTITDRNGAYRLSHVPSGSHRLVLDQRTLPADYRVDVGEREVTVRGQRKYEVNFRVIPLNTMSGMVFCDKNANGACDPGEGVAGAVIRLNGFVTASGRDGAFAFYNLAPGPHTVVIDTERLPRGYALVGASEVRAELTPDRPLSGIVFQVRKQEKPVIFQEPSW